MIKKILILGGEGNGGIIAACIKDMHDNFGYKDLEFCGFLNDKIEIGTIVNNYPVMGKTSDVNKFIEKGYYFIFADFCDCIYCYCVSSSGNKKRQKV